MIFHPQCRRYLDAFNDRMMEAYDHFGQGRTEISTLWGICGLHREDETPQEHETAGVIIGNYMADTLALAYGHEIGHVWYSHPWSQLHPPCTLAPRLPPNQRREACADDFGWRLALKAGFEPYSALGTTFPMFAAIEGESGASGTGTHPAAMCRMLIMAKNIQRDPTIFAPTPKDTDQIRKLRESARAQIDDLVTTLTTPIPGFGGKTVCPTPID